MRRAARRGFTLIEIVVSLGILGLIAGMTWSSISSALEAREILVEQDSIQRSARVTLGKLQRELELAFLTPNTTAINTYRTVFIGRDEEPIDQVWFASLSHQRLYQNARESDQTEITIWGETNPEGDHYVLLHRESERIDHEPDKDGVILPLAYQVRRLELQYLDGTTGEWLEEWDSTSLEQSERLPRAVRIGLVLMAPHPEKEDEEIEVPFATTVMLQFANPVSRSLFATGGTSTELIR